MEDRIDMVIDIRELGITSGCLLNVLNPILVRRLQNFKTNRRRDFMPVLCLFSVFNLNGDHLFAGGRGNMCDKGKSAFQSGANAAISQIC